MKNSIILTLILIIAGLGGVAVGGGILLDPVAFHATSGVRIDGGTNLMNEIRAAGGALLACGLIILAGAFVRGLTFAATLMATTFYLAYGLSRLLSLSIDGLPGAELLQITVLELGVGLVCLLALIRYRESGETSESTT